MSGVILGGLLSRFLSGVLTDAFGWRTPYFVLAGALVLAAAGLARTMPRHDPGRPGSPPSGTAACSSRWSR